jgi:transposase
MSGIYHFDIQESAEELKQMLLVEKVQALYLLKTGYDKTVSETAKIIGINRSTVQEWLRLYRTQGIEGLRQQKHSLGRPRAIPKWAEKALQRFSG